MIRPISISALPDYQLQLRFSNGVEGVLDISDTVGRGVFEALRDKAFFATVYLGDRGQIAWSEELELCPDAAYEEITAKIPVEANDA